MIVNPKVVLEQMITSGQETCQIQQNGIDLTVKSIQRIMHDQRADPGNKKMADRSDATNVTYLDNGYVYEIRFEQSINVPKDACAWIHTRSSFVRNGVQCWSGLYDSGFSGELGCVLKCHGPGIILRPGERLAQLIVTQADSASLYEGYWNGK